MNRHPWTRRGPVLLLLCSSFFIVVTDSTLVYAALPSIGRELDLGPRALPWVVTAYLLGCGGLLLLGGRLADLFRRDRVFTGGCALFTGMSLLAGSAWSGEVLIAARGAQGVGAAVMVPAALSLLTSTFPEGQQRNRALAIWGGLAGVGATAGLLLGGPITDLLGWRWVFLVNVPGGAVAGALAVTRLPVPTRPRSVERRLDVRGAVVATTALTALVYAIVSAPDPTTGWERSASAAGLAVVLAMLFVRLERRSPHALVPMRLVTSRTVIGGNLTVLAAGMSVDGLLYGSTLLTQEVFGYSAIRFGLAAAMMTGVSFVGVAVGQHVVGRRGARAVAMPGFACIATGSLLLARGAAGRPPTLEVLVALALLGLGVGATFVAGQIAALSGVADGDAGLAAGIEESTFTLGNALGVALVASIVVARPELGDGLRWSFSAIVLISTLGALAARTLVDHEVGTERAIGSRVAPGQNSNEHDRGRRST
jgi:MFS family permease